MFKFIKIIFLKTLNVKKTFEFEPFFYLDNFNKPTFNQTNKTYKLPKFIIHDFSKERAIKKAIKYIDNNYPHLKEIIIIL